MLFPGSKISFSMFFILLMSLGIMAGSYLCAASAKKSFLQKKYELLQNENERKNEVQINEVE